MGMFMSTKVARESGVPGLLAEGGTVIVSTGAGGIQPISRITNNKIQISVEDTVYGIPTSLSVLSVNIRVPYQPPVDFTCQTKHSSMPGHLLVSYPPSH